MAYYFLVAELPYLTYQAQQPPMSSAAFLDLCRGALSAKDAALLPYCALGVKEGEDAARTPSPFINEWLKRERTLVLTLAQLRAAKLKREAPEAPHDSFEAETQARAAFALENPLEAELLLDKGRWEAVETLTGTDYFGVNVVYAYLIKLLLIERRCSFNMEEGFKEYQTLYGKILKGAPGAFPLGETK